MHALDHDEHLTPLGHHLAALPVDVYIGKLLLFGCIFRCVDPILTIAAALSHRNPFYNSQGMAGFVSANSDLVVIWRAYDEWCRAKSQNMEKIFCNEKALSVVSLRTILDLKIQFCEILSDIGFLKSGITRKSISKLESAGFDGVLKATGSLHNTNSENSKMIRAIICAGLYPHVVRVDAPQQTCIPTVSGPIPVAPQAKELRMITKNHERVFVHPQSVNFTRGEYESPWLVFHSKFQTSKLYLRDVTMAPPYSLLLFSFGTNITVQHGRELIIVDEWIKFCAPARIAVLVKEIRNSILELLDEKIRNPQLDISTSELINVVTKLIMNDGFM